MDHLDMTNVADLKAYSGFANIKLSTMEAEIELFDFYQGLLKPSGNNELELASSYCSAHTFKNRQSRLIVGQLSHKSQLILRTHYGDTPNFTRQVFKNPKAAGASYLARIPGINPQYNKLFVNLLAEYYLFEYEQSVRPDDLITAHNGLPLWKALQQNEKWLLFKQINKIYPDFKANQIGKMIDDIKKQMQVIIDPAIQEYIDLSMQTQKSAKASPREIK